MKVKKILKAVLCVLIAFVLIIGAYVAYVFIDYHRIDDNLKLDTKNITSDKVKLNDELSIMSWNIGFCAYSDDYSFFMDGGKYSRAISKESVNENLNGIINTAKNQNTDFALFQEVDIKSDRSYKINQNEIITNTFDNYSNTFAVNYDSPYLFYPFNCPFGKSYAGNLTLSKYNITSALRRSLPIEGGFMKIIDLDRCYSINRIPTEDGKELVIYNLHLSAYTSDVTIATEQLKVLFNDISSEYSKGNYIICGGDFNKDLLGDSSKVFGVSSENQTWAQSFDFDLLPENFKLIAPHNENNPVPSCRNSDIPYEKGVTFVLTVDGFIVSDNIEVLKSDVIDTEFKYTDHNPVYMNFVLKNSNTENND